MGKREKIIGIVWSLIIGFWIGYIADSNSVSLGLIGFMIAVSILNRD